VGQQQEEERGGRREQQQQLSHLFLLGSSHAVSCCLFNQLNSAIAENIFRFLFEMFLKLWLKRRMLKNGG
jgi:hypothetical protein